MASSAATLSTPSREREVAITPLVERPLGRGREHAAASSNAAALIGRVARRCRVALEGDSGDTRLRAMDDVEHAVTDALAGRPVAPAASGEMRPLRAALDRLRDETRVEVTRQSAPCPGSQVARLWGAFDAVERSLSRRQPAPAALSDAELYSVSEVVHDLRSPLSSIMLLSDALSQRFRSRDDDVAQRQAGLIRGAALAMHELVSDLRDLARGAHALMDPTPVTFSLAEIMGSVASLVRPLAEEKGLTFRVTMPDRAVATGYPTPLTRVLLNLVTNGLKFTEHGVVEVVVTPMPQGGTRFLVRDSGAGLPARITALVAGQPLYAGERAAKVSGEFGVGLGLSLCIRLVKLMHGTLRLDQSVATGTCFVVELPLMLASTDDAGWSAAPHTMVAADRADARVAHERRGIQETNVGSS